MIVADASVVIEVLFGSRSAPAVAERLFEPGQTLHAPHLIDIEVAHVIRRYATIGDIGDDRGRTAIQDLADMPIRRYPHGELLPRVWELQGNLSAYDAVYVALAEALDATLLTRDRRLFAAASRYARIEML